MERKHDLKCWEIMDCKSDEQQQCPSYREETPCWEVMRKLDSPCVNVCSDCLVYISHAKNGETILSDKEIAYIFRQRGLTPGQKGICCPRYQIVEAEDHS